MNLVMVPENKNKNKTNMIITVDCKIERIHLLIHISEKRKVALPELLDWVRLLPAQYECPNHPFKC